ncbi:unnamed protein product, partial [Polarella glacialis]
IPETMPRSTAGAGRPTKEPSLPLLSWLKQMRAQWGLLLRDSEVRAALGINCAAWFAHAGANMTLLPLMLAGGQLALSPAQIGSVFAAQSALNLLLTGPAASATDRFGPGNVIAPSLAMTTVAIALFPLAEDLMQASAVLALWTAGGSLLSSAPTVMAANHVAPEARSQALAMVRTVGDLGLLAGATSVGLAATAFGAGPAMQGTAALLGTVTSGYFARQMLRRAA